VNFRCSAGDSYIEGAEKGALKGLFELMKKSDIFINLGT
jgi:hypothetical protein